MTTNITVIVGLGNIGKQYEHTRHNIGFMVIDALADIYGDTSQFTHKMHSNMQHVTIDGKRVLLCKPTTLMNLSGKAVSAIQQFYKYSPDNIIVIHDELDITLGDMRYKCGGGDAGHNGLKDITRYIGANYHRIRLGIGRPQHGSVSDYVLNKFTQEELDIVTEINKKTAENIKYLLQNNQAAFKVAFNETP